MRSKLAWIKNSCKKMYFPKNVFKQINDCTFAHANKNVSEAIWKLKKINRT